MVRRAAPLLSAGLVVVLGACSSPTGARGPAGPSVLPAAPEPAAAPTPDVTPAGRVVALGVQEPEGAVVDPRSGLLAVSARRPATLVLVDPAAGRVVRRVVVPGAARHLQLAAGGGAVLVPGEDTDVLATVALPAGAVTASVRVGRQPHDAVAVGGVVLDSDELGNSVTASRGGTVVSTLPGPVQPGGIAASGSRAAAVAVRGRLLHVYDPDPLREVARVPVGAGPTHVVDVGGGVVAVTDTGGGQVLLVRISGTPALLAAAPLPGRPYGVAFDPARSRLWVSTTADNRLHRLDLVEGGLRPVADYPTVRQANSIAVVPATGRVLVVGATPAGVLQVLDP